MMVFKTLRVYQINCITPKIFQVTEQVSNTNSPLKLYINCIQNTVVLNM